MKPVAIAVAQTVLILSAVVGVARGVDAYDRDAYGDDVNVRSADCMSLRNELLTSSAKFIATQDDAECKVVSGLWIDPYTGNEIRYADELQIDHLIPLAWADAHGASEWSSDQKHAFARDPKYLRAVSGSLNASKGDRGFDEWLPPAAAAHCDYVTAFRDGVRAYSLNLTWDENAQLEKLFSKECRPENGTVSAQAALLAPIALAALPSDQPNVILASGDIDCADFSTQSDAQVFYEANRPGDPHGLDRNDDGLACVSLP